MRRRTAGRSLRRRPRQGARAVRAPGQRRHHRPPISFPPAAVGTEVEVPTLDGKVKLKIQAGTQSGKGLFRLKGKGFLDFHGYGRGDQLVRMVVETPRRLTARQRELLEEFAGIGTVRPSTIRFPRASWTSSKRCSAEFGRASAFIFLLASDSRSRFLVPDAAITRKPGAAGGWSASWPCFWPRRPIGIWACTGILRRWRLP